MDGNSSSGAGTFENEKENSMKTNPNADSQLMPCPNFSKVTDLDERRVSSSPNATSSNGSARRSDSGPSTGTGTTSGTVSSADTVPNSSQDISQESAKPKEDEAPSCWGQIYSLREEFYPLDLVKDRYTFGRKADLDYSFDIPSIKKNQHFIHYSKNHFAICRTTQSDGSTQTFVEDLGGTNGTYINGEKMVPKTKRPLMCKDKIALSYAWNDIFMFSLMNTESFEDNEFSQKYIMGKQIGNGACGSVHEVWLKVGCGRFALKLIRKKSLSSFVTGASSNDIMSEARILKKLNHPGIIGINEVIDFPDKLFIILEYAVGGDLFLRISEKGALPEPLAKLYFFQMLHAVTYLHDNGITHRDLKPENVLLMSNKEPCIIKLSDFGISRLIPEETLMHTLAGTQSYWSPEIIQSMSVSYSGYTHLVDIWSLGVILFVCLVAYPPFANGRQDTNQSLRDQILSANFNFKPAQWNTVSELGKIFISSLLKVDIDERLNSNQAMKHAWLNDPEMRANAAELLNVEEDILTPSIEKSFSGSSSATSKISVECDQDSRAIIERSAYLEPQEYNLSSQHSLLSAAVKRATEEGPPSHCDSPPCKFAKRI